MAIEEKITAAEVLLRCGAVVNTLDNLGETPLHRAYILGEERLVNLLIKFAPGHAIDTAPSLLLLRQQEQNALGHKVMIFIDAMTLYIRTTQDTATGTILSEAQSISQAITYAGKVVCALSKGEIEYKSLLDKTEDYVVPKPLVEDFIMPYIREHRLLLLMEHPEFSRSLSIALGYASQNPCSTGKKDFTALRAEYMSVNFHVYRRTSLSPTRSSAALFAISGSEHKSPPTLSPATSPTSRGPVEKPPEVPNLN